MSSNEYPENPDAVPPADGPPPLAPAGDASPDPPVYGQAIPTGSTAPPAAEENTAAAPLTAYPFEFRGTGAEFFRIWIVNIALTVVTLGFYLPWARVRTRKYFYGNTLLNDRTFDYLAKPTALLKGYLIVVGALLLFNIASALQMWWLMILLVPIYLGVYPWLIFKSLRFKCHNSAYSNVRLRFTGTCSHAYLTYMVVPLMMLVGSILVVPFQAYMQKKYVYNNLAVGHSESKTEMKLEKFYLYYLIYLIPVALIFVFAILAAAAMPAFTKMAETARERAAQDATTEERILLEGEDDLTVLESPDSPSSPTADANAGPEATPTDEEIAELLRQMSEDGEADDWEDDEMGGPDFENIGATEVAIIAAMVGFYLLFILLALLFQQFVFVKTTNYTMVNTTLGSCRLHSDMRVRDVLWIMISNVVLCLLTIGIYIPWAMARMRKYRIEHMKVFAYGELQEFIASSEAEQGALGDAAGDYLDFEIGF